MNSFNGVINLFDLANLPERIANIVEGLPWSRDDVGESSAAVVLFDNMVLKIEPVSRSSENEIKLLQWLDGKLPVPKVIVAEVINGYSFLLMSRLVGEMACSDDNKRGANGMVKALAKGLKMLWAVDITGCPCVNNVSEKLVQARFNIDNGLVDYDDFDDDTFGEGGFADVHDLYRFLDGNRPKEELVFSHGDFCLPNVFVDGASVTGFIDWGNGGVADKWQDVALCVRSLKYNLENFGHGEKEIAKYESLLFQELGLEPNEEKIRYYILLDELF